MKSKKSDIHNDSQWFLINENVIGINSVFKKKTESFCTPKGIQIVEIAENFVYKWRYISF